MAVPRMHDDEVEIDDSTVRRLLAREQPDLSELPLTRLDTWGTDHVIYRLGTELAVRLPKIAWAAEQGVLERRWLGELASELPVAVPVPRYVGQPGFGYPFRWCVSPWLDGSPVVPGSTELTGLAVELAGFVRSLGAAPSHGGPVAAPDQRGGPLCAPDDGTVVGLDLLRGEIDVDRLLDVWRAGAAAPAWAGAPRWVHADLNGGNLLLRDGRLSGVIDWGCLTTGDPAVELMAAWTLFDAPARAVYRRELGFVDDAMWLRGRAWAVMAALMALPYYRLTNPDIVARSERCANAVLEDLGTG